MKRQEITSIVHSLMADCLRVSRHDGPLCFFDYAPHVEAVFFRLYSNGWKDYTDWDYSVAIYLDSSKTAEEVKEMLKPIYIFVEANQ